MKIFLDMDGVLVNFIKGSLSHHGILDTFEYPKGEWHFEKLIENFWSGMDKDFWANLEWEDDGIEIIRYLEYKYKDICILSSPSKSSGCIDGKIEWINRNLPQYARKMIFTPQKHMCAHAGALLIDDSEKNVNLFQMHGGQAILLPRISNKLHGLCSLTYLRQELNKLS